MDKQFGKRRRAAFGSGQCRSRGRDFVGLPLPRCGFGRGRFPRWRVTEIYGRSRPAKLPWRCWSLPRHRKPAAWRLIDAEHALDAGYARKLGVDVDNLLVSQPDTGEQALEITAALVQSGAVDVVVIDSVARARAKGRTRRGNGRQPHGSACPADVAGAAKADRQRFED